MLLVYVQDVDSQSIALLKRPATLSAHRLQTTDQFNSQIIHYRTHASQATVELLRFLYICCPTLRFFLFPPLSLPFPFRSPCCFFLLPPIPLHFFAPFFSISFSYIPPFHSIPIPFKSTQFCFFSLSFPFSLAVRGSRVSVCLCVCLSVCVSVRLSVCLFGASSQSHISQTECPNLTKFSVHDVYGLVHRCTTHHCRKRRRQRVYGHDTIAILRV